jgi:hypothetical protein
MSPFYRAQLETPHFSFEAYGRSEAEASEALERAWAQHCRDCGIANNWPEWLESVNLLRVELGRAYRDGAKCF